jgi:succinyl-CoA synthetase alpha subunit
MINFNVDAHILIQGITQPPALEALLEMRSYGMNLLAGVAAGEGSQTVEEVEVFDLVEQAIDAYPAIDTTIIFVPALDMIELLRYTANSDVWVLGSGSAGLIVPSQILLGTLDATMFTPGQVGIISRSHSLIYEVVELLNGHHIGQSLVVHLGSDPIRGSNSSSWLSVFDHHTEQILLLGDMSIDQDLRHAAALLKQQVISYNPQLQTMITPITDAARLLRIGQGELDREQPSAPLKIATSLDQIVQLVQAAL